MVYVLHDNHVMQELDDSEIEALRWLLQAYSVLSKALDKLRLESEISAIGDQPSIIMTGSVGRPKFDIFVNN